MFKILKLFQTRFYQQSNRLYAHMHQLVDNSSWPLLLSCSISITMSGVISWTCHIQHGGFLLGLGLISLAITLIVWFMVTKKIIFLGNDTLGFRRGLMAGFTLFMILEILFFIGFIWGYIEEASRYPGLIESLLPPLNFLGINMWSLSLLNTIILLISGFSIIWTHKSLNANFWNNNTHCDFLKNHYAPFNAYSSFLITIFLGILFLGLQTDDYRDLAFLSMADGNVIKIFFYFWVVLLVPNYHTIAIYIFIIICFFRFIIGHLTLENHMSFLFTVFFWHSIDAIWLFLFMFMYIFNN